MMTDISVNSLSTSDWQNQYDTEGDIEGDVSLHDMRQ